MTVEGARNSKTDWLAPARRQYRSRFVSLALRLRITPLGLLGTAVFLLLLFFVVLPLGGIVWQSLRSPARTLTLDNYFSFFQSRRLLESTLNTIFVGTISAIGSVLIATPLAFGVTRTQMLGKKLVYLATIVSFASPGFLVAFSYILLAGPNAGYLNIAIRELFDLDISRGPLNILSVWGFMLLSLPHSVAFAFLIMVPAFQRMDIGLEEASWISGAGPIETIFRVTLPVMRAAMLAAGLMAFSSGITEFAVPYVLGIDVLTVSMRGAIYSANFSLAATIASISAAMSLLVLALYRRSIKHGERYQTVGGKGGREGGVLELGACRHFFTALGLLYSILGSFLPTLLLVAISFMRAHGDGFAPSNFTFQYYVYLIENPSIRWAITRSLVLGSLAAAVVTILGFLIAYLMTRAAIRWRGVMDYLSILPVGIAGTAFAVGVIVVNLQTPLRGLALYGTILILLVAYIGRFIPWGVRTMQVGLLQVSSQMEEASRVCGAGQIETIWRITLRLVRPAMAYAWIFGFVQAFTEVSASAILTGATSAVNSTQMLTLYDTVNGLQKACAMGIVILLITIPLVVLAQRLGGRSFSTKQSAV